MNLKFIKKSVVLVALAGTMVLPVQQVLASEGMEKLTSLKQSFEVNENFLANTAAELKKNAVTEVEIKIESAEEIQLRGKLADKNFAQVEEEYLKVFVTEDENGKVAGKLYEDSVLTISERTEEWARITSGELTGYIKTSDLLTGNDAYVKAKELLEEKYADKDVFALTEKEIEEGFSVGETKEAEEARIAAEEAARIAAEKAAEEARIAAEKAARAQRGNNLVAYAKQFIGNPYVWGGTSLTNGTDCSGFVMRVYEHFGVSLPRTSTSMRSVGYAVSYSDIQPGDIVCYSGHVGIYAGNGQIVNAIDDAHGIGMSSATYTSIITIRRIF